MLSSKPSSPILCHRYSATDTLPTSLASAFDAIKAHRSYHDPDPVTAIYNIKHAAKKSFLTETHQEFTDSLEVYVGGAMAFAQEAIKFMFDVYGEHELSTTLPGKKGTVIFTSTLGAIRSNSEFASYGAGRAGVRQLAQSLGKEFGSRGIHVVHVIVNSAIVDDATDDAVVSGKKMLSESVGKTYAWLVNQTADLWTDELDMRPA